MRNSPVKDMMAVKNIAGMMEDRSRKTIYDFPLYSCLVIFAPMIPAGKINEAILATID